MLLRNSHHINLICNFGNLKPVRTVGPRIPDSDYNLLLDRSIDSASRKSTILINKRFSF